MVVDNKLISIIVPIYNACNYLDACINSICAQSYDAFELILVDDGSTDNSLEICMKYQQIDGRVIVIHQDNAGVSAARNSGLALAKGEYFCFVDSDDAIEQNMLEKLYEMAEESQSDLCICGFKCCSKKENKYFKPKKEEVTGKREIADFVSMHYLEWLVSSPCGKLYKNIQFPTRRFDTNISLGEDLKFNIEYFKNINKIAVIDECLYLYNDTEGSLTKSYKSGHFEAICDIFDTTIVFFDELNSKGYAFDLKNVNYKLFSFSISFMYQHIIAGNNIRESIDFISKICNNISVQNAVCNLPNISFKRKLYVVGIKRKSVFLLWFLSYVKASLAILKLRFI